MFDRIDLKINIFLNVNNNLYEENVHKYVIEARKILFKEYIFCLIF